MSCVASFAKIQAQPNAAGVQAYLAPLLLAALPPQVTTSILSTFNAAFTL